MIDVNLKGVLYGIAAALPVFRKQGFGHFVNVISTAGLKIVPMQSVYAGTKNAVRILSEGLRQEAGANLRVTTVSPGFVHTDFAESMTNPDVKAQIVATRDKLAIQGTRSPAPSHSRSSSRPTSTSARSSSVPPRRGDFRPCGVGALI